MDFSAIHLTVGLAVGIVLLGFAAVQWRARQRPDFEHSTQTGESGLSSHWLPDRPITLPQWSDDLVCGHPIIDAQHRHLVEASATLVEQALAGGHPREILRQLADLVEHISRHLAAEEAILARTRFPLSDEHRFHHEWLLAAARSLHERVRSGQADLAELVDFVSDDLIAGHVRDEDLKFALKKTPSA